ncbi:MAG: PEP-CTERM sorting domain-containing protein [Zoogloeaceae bacterium]|nr:PEP-CTERM sorting domain-containing protein [Zoogloeaceae bacterium]
MRKVLKRIAYVSAIGLGSSLAAGPAVAVALTGDTITFDGGPVVVGAGIDRAFGVFAFDFDAGPDGDIFQWTSSASGFLGGTPFVPNIFDLDFNDGSTLVGFDLTSTLLSNLSFVVTPDSITFSHTSTGFVGPGVVISGRFITTSTAVPEPTALTLVALGLAGFALNRRSAIR